MKKLLLLTFFIVSFLSAVSAQNRFEGYNIILDAVDEPHADTICAIRYPPTESTNITISDLDPSTPMNVRSCDGAGMRVAQNGSIATTRASMSTYKWCFEGEDKRYRISFQGDQYSKTVIYDWIPDPPRRENGYYNVRDFGAVGNGRADDTIAIQSALAFLATRNGGTLFFPEGDYIVGGIPNYRGLVVPSGVTIQGVSGIASNSPTNNVNQKSPSRLVLTGTNRALLKVGECADSITVKDIELLAQNNENTYGFLAVGTYQGAQNFYFERVTFNSFYRGIYGRGVPNKQNINIWQFDYIKVNHCRFIYNRDAGIYNDVQNSDWKIEGSLFINPKKQPGQNANSMHFERAAAVLIQDTYGGGFPSALGGTFLSLFSTSVITVITSQTENMTNSIYLNEVNNPYLGDYSAPITLVNSIFGNPIVLNARVTFVSTGGLYAANTFKAGPLVRVYSTGDRFCYDGGIANAGCLGIKPNNFDKATVVFATGQPSDFGKTENRPTFFGTDVQFGAPVQMPSLPLNQLPANSPNGALVYCQNCRRSTTPCQAGGTGAPAMMVNKVWSCL